MTKGTLKRISSNHSNMRTQEMIGEFVEYPQVGYKFCIYGDPLDVSLGVRVITTTPILTLEANTERVIFTTKNSKYELTIKGN